MAISGPTYHRDSGEAARLSSCARHLSLLAHRVHSAALRNLVAIGAWRTPARRPPGALMGSRPNDAALVIVARARIILPVARPAAAVVGGRVAVSQRPHILEAAHVVVIAEPVQAQAPAAAGESLPNQRANQWRRRRGERCEAFSCPLSMRPRDAARATENARKHCGLYVRGVTKAARSFICPMGWAHREIDHTRPAAIDGYRRQTGRTENAAPTRRRVFWRDKSTRRANQSFATKTCPALVQKIFRFRRRANQFYQLAPSIPGKRGVRHRHERGMGCGGRGSVGAQGDRRAG